jgi:hypothetical protein
MPHYQFRHIVDPAPAGSRYDLSRIVVEAEQRTAQSAGFAPEVLAVLLYERADEPLAKFLREEGHAWLDAHLDSRHTIILEREPTEAFVHDICGTLAIRFDKLPCIAFVARESRVWRCWVWTIQDDDGYLRTFRTILAEMDAIRNGQTATSGKRILWRLRRARLLRHLGRLAQPVPPMLVERLMKVLGPPS